MTWTHGAALVYRDTADRREYLLVSAPKDPNQLVIPTGHIEKRDKRDAVAAPLRELHEAGIAGDVVAQLDDLTYSLDGKQVRTAVFLLKFRESVAAAEKRTTVWVGLDGRPGKPVDNAFIESFNGKDYNEHRPHSSLAGLTPVEYEMQVRTSRTD